ncbi:hypothetical protein OTU49_004126, partial [Cherax quadricarinatus]
VYCMPVERYLGIPCPLGRHEMHEQRFCCCSCSIRGACYSIAGGKLLILLNDALLMWYNLLLEGGTWTMVHFVMVIIEMLFCLILLVGLRLAAETGAVVGVVVRVDPGGAGGHRGGASREDAWQDPLPHLAHSLHGR